MILFRRLFSSPTRLPKISKIPGKFFFLRFVKFFFLKFKFLHDQVWNQISRDLRSCPLKFSSKSQNWIIFSKIILFKKTMRTDIGKLMILAKMFEKTQKLCRRTKIIDQFLQFFGSCQNWFLAFCRNKN